jgi:cyclopropane fatty-acyl-phospholipid synthase-like methyltransferase
MSKENRFYPKFSYDEHARTCASDDFLGQTRRTENGVPVSDEQIQMIVSAIKSGLDFSPEDVLLELACGNGALSQYLFNSCKDYLGVDLSEHLIAVAKENFEALPHYHFSVQGAAEYVRNELRPEKFTKMLCYAGFQYFPDEEAEEILSSISKKFNNIQTIFIGNLPDKSRAEEFYKSRQPSKEEISDGNTAIGIWRTREEFEQLAGKSGWNVKFSTMPTEFYASYYRYDALLRR